jgi:ribosomal protein L37E
MAFGNGSAPSDAFGVKGFFFKALFVGLVGIILAQVGAGALQSAEKRKQPRTHTESPAKREASKNKDAIYCSRCGDSSKATAKYCSKCGTALSNDDPT